MVKTTWKMDSSPSCRLSKYVLGEVVDDNFQKNKDYGRLMIVVVQFNARF